MVRFWRKIALFWHEFRNCRKYGACIRPDSIRAKAEDLGIWRNWQEEASC